MLTGTILGLFAAVAASSAPAEGREHATSVAASQARAAAAAELDGTVSDILSAAHKLREEGETLDDPTAIAKFQAAFPRAVELYIRQPEDAAAVQAVQYVFVYCKYPLGQSLKACERALPRARQMILQYHVNDEHARRIVLESSDADLAFLDTWFARCADSKMKGEIAVKSGELWQQRFHNPTLSDKDRQEAYRMAIKYGEFLLDDSSVVHFQGKSIPSYLQGKVLPLQRWRGEGILNSVQAMAVGQPMPDYSYAKLTGGVDSLRNYRGKVILMDFWASWCVPCVASMPRIGALREELQGAPFEVVSVDTDGDPQTALNLQRKKLPMPWVNWHLSPFSEEFFKLSINSLPSYFVLGADGTILWRAPHFDDVVKQKVRAAVQKASASSKGNKS